ncbi:MAG: alpha-L-fucosidase [Bacteroidota bacterium]
MNRSWTLLLTALLAFACSQPTQQKEETTAAAEEQPVDKMEWWRDARFGMFIHWGPYAVPAGEHKGERTPNNNAEWIMHHMNIPIVEYEEYSRQFNPVEFDAKEWVSIAKDAGMKYIVITSKHHDGFCLWDSKVSEYDIMDTSPFQRDILKELDDACKEAGITFCFYHSIMDWHHPDAQAMWEPNYNQANWEGQEPKVNPNFRRYLDDYMMPQVKELITNYNPGVMWFDGEWIPDYTTEMGKEVYNELIAMNPNLIINNRVDKGRQGMQGMNKEGVFAGDFGTPEQEIPDTGLEGVDWESCMTMNDSWGYKHFDDNWKSSEMLIQNLVDIASKGGNYLLNVGPTPAGLIPPESVERLAAMGNWIDQNGESIYGTEASPYERPSWGRYTKKGNKVYAHVFEWPADGRLELENATHSIKKAYLLSEAGAELAVSGTTVTLPSDAPDDVDTVIALEI